MAKLHWDGSPGGFTPFEEEQPVPAPSPEALPITLSVANVKYLLTYFNACDESGHCRCCGAQLVAPGDHSSFTCKLDCQIKHIRNMVHNAVGDAMVPERKP